MSSKLQSDWINQTYTDLTDTLANDEHKIVSGITKKTFSPTSKVTAQSISDLITSIKSLNNNNFIKNYADCFKNNEDLTIPTAKNPIKETTKTEIDNYMDDIMRICGNEITTNYPSTGFNQGDNNFHPARGCFHYINNFRSNSNTPTFATEGSGFGRWGSGAGKPNSNAGDSTHTGYTQCGDDFQDAFGNSNCTDNFQPSFSRTDYGVVIGQPNVLNTNS